MNEYYPHCELFQFSWRCSHRWIVIGLPLKKCSPLFATRKSIVDARRARDREKSENYNLSGFLASWHDIILFMSLISISTCFNIFLHTHTKNSIKLNKSMACILTIFWFSIFPSIVCQAVSIRFFYVCQ